MDYILIFSTSINFCFSYLLTLIFVPLIRKFALARGIFDIPNERKLHTKPIPRLGGCSLALSFLLVSILSNYLFPDKNLLNSEKEIYLIISALGFFTLGLVDDLKKLSPILRLVFQFLLATLFTVKVLSFSQLKFVFPILDQNISFDVNIIFYVISAIWIVGVTNAINWIDGLDGLLVGNTLLVTLALSYVSLINDNYSALQYSVFVLGFCLAFFKFNSPKASIYLGDGGSYFIGFLLSVLPIISVNNNSFFYDQSILNINFIFTFFILFVPIIDMPVVILSRLIRGKSPFYPDRNHFHHRLIDAGFSVEKTLFVICLITFCTSVFAMIFE